MSISSVVIGLFGGAAATLAARKIVDIWNRNKGAIQTELAKDLNSADKYIEDHWGVDLNNGNDAAADQIVAKGIAIIDKYAASKDFWKLVISNITTMNPAKFAEYVAQIRSLDVTGIIKTQLSAGLMSIVNQTKKEEAVKLIANKAVMANVIITDIPVKVEAAVATAKVRDPKAPVTKEELELLVIESEKRQAALRANTK